MALPTVFIGSSREQSDTAHALAALLEEFSIADFEARFPAQVAIRAARSAPQRKLIRREANETLT